MVVTPEKFSYRGIIVPVLTPFNDDRTKSVNLDEIPKYAKFLKDSGVEGVLVNGTTGEGMLLSVAERKLILEAWKKAVSQNKMHLMVQVGGAPLPDVKELALHAESVGVDSILSLPELYYKPQNCEELINYLKLVSAAAPKTPLLYYHIPKFNGVTVNMGEFLNQVDGKIDTFVGIKFTSTVLDEGLCAAKANCGRFVIFLGTNDLLVGGLALGFNSAICSLHNLLPKLGKEILNQVKGNDIKKAADIQNQLNEVITTLNKYGKWIPVLKAAVNLITPINVGASREPLMALNSEQKRNLESDLKRLKLL